MRNVPVDSNQPGNVFELPFQVAHGVGKLGEDDDLLVRVFLHQQIE